MRYEPTRASLGSHPVPTWYHDAKLGIFIHWGLFSIPAFAPRGGSILDVMRADYDDFVIRTPYTEWYENAIRFPDSPSARYHREHYGGRPYADFRNPFEAGLERWDPDAWADLFREAGARYVVLVTKHHDGYCLWPTKVPHPHREGWHCERDVVGDLARAVRARGLRFGVYYSGGIDWSFVPTPLRNLGDFLASVPTDEAYQSYAEAQVRELVERVRPDVLWNDIAWPTDEARLLRLFADYYEVVPEGVVNDRWQTPNFGTRVLRTRLGRGLANFAVKQALRFTNPLLSPPPPAHCDYRTPEYASFDRIRRQKWESVRGIGNSFAWNREEPESDLLTIPELVRSFADIVSKNGNLLLNVGPEGEGGAIPRPQAERVRGLGAWLGRNGDAIYGTRPWERADGSTREGAPVRFTAGPDLVFVTVLEPPAGRRLTVADFPVDPVGVRLLGHGDTPWRRDGADLVVDLPEDGPREPALSLEIRTASVAGRSISGGARDQAATSR